MTVGVYSIKKILFKGEANEVNCPTMAGEITVLDNHRPLISLLTRGSLKIIDKNGETKYIPISSGLLEVRHGSEARFLVEE